MNFNTNFNSQKPPSFKMPGNLNFKKVKRISFIVIVIIIFMSVAGTCWYTVNEKQQAVVTTFGKITSKTGAGIHFKLPFGIQKVQKVDVNIYQKIELGYRSNAPYEGYEVIEKESKMITGDYNIVSIDFFVEYKISDPEKYLFNSYEPEVILKNLVQSQIRNVIGSSTVDSILTDGKSEIQIKTKELITAILEDYDIGLILNDIKIQDSEPPTATVIEAFKAVETAKQTADTLLNQAKAYKNSKLPNAQADADKLIQNAEYLKQNRINDAVKQIALFEAMYSEYALNPNITKTRMYYEAITEALPNVKLFIDTTDGGVQKILPLESFVVESEVNK